MSTRPRTTQRSPSRADESRVLPFSIAGVVCFLLALIIGYSGWLLFNTQKRSALNNENRVIQTPPAPVNVENREPSATQKEAPASGATVRAPAGELNVAGGVIALGGEGTDEPLRRETVEPFAIGETEVTNEQYAEFIKATGHKAPSSWSNGEFRPGTQNDPVVNVTWQDGVDYCAWLSEKIGAEVRLPSEKEWVLAAAGENNLKYPWGHELKPRAANYKDTKLGVLPVKSFPEGRSPCGAYDMAGNVWEWTSDDARDQEGKPKEQQGVKRKIIKGGSAAAKQDYLVTSARFDLPSNAADPVVGFRYVVIRQNKPAQSPTP